MHVDGNGAGETFWGIVRDAAGAAVLALGGIVAWLWRKVMAVAALEEHNRLDRELTAKADAIERRALALAANQPEPPQYYANSDPPHGRIVPTPGPPKPHPLTPPTVIIMRDGATATPQPAATVKESQCDCGCNCPGCECNKRKAATAKQ